MVRMKVRKERAFGLRNHGEVENLSGESALSVRSVKVLKMQEPELDTRALRGV